MKMLWGPSLVAVAFGILAAPLSAQTGQPVQPASAGARAVHAPRSNAYGTTVESKYHVPVSAFLPSNSNTTYDENGLLGYRFATGGLPALVAPLHLPSGAKIVSLELDYYDGASSAAVSASLVVCDYLDVNCSQHPLAGDGPIDCINPGYLCSGAANAPGLDYIYSTAIAADGLSVDNNDDQLSLLVENVSSDLHTGVAGMVVGYVLQVSPAPATATFSDVPTSSPQFKFVEALVAAGITAGCGGGNYCPTQPITRGQMAVFLATALGLQFR